MSEMMKIVAGLDIGNGYVKGKAKEYGAGGKPIRIDLPSVVADAGMSAVNMQPFAADDKYMAGIDNELDATVSSNVIPEIDAGRLFFGQRGIRFSERLREFDISDNTTPKCEDSLSTILVLGALTSAALRMYWDGHNELPDSLSIDACIGIALPIEDFNEYKEVYPNRLMSCNHVVLVHNFGDPIPVTIHFSAVRPIAEGAAAQYAITELGAGFLQNALDMARHDGANIDEMYTGEMLVNSMNTIGIDIGEGNVNFPVYTEGRPAIESSRSIAEGYGTVLTRVVHGVRNIKGFGFKSRKELGDYMQGTPDTPVKMKRQKRLNGYIAEEVNSFCRDVLSEFTNIYNNVGATTDVVYIYGGGASKVHDVLYGLIMKAVTDDEGEAIPVIYLDASYSRDLNRNGLFSVASAVADTIWSE